MLDSSKEHNQSGTGFGLYQSNLYAKELCFPHGKGITINSKKDKGSTFSFIL